MSESGSHHPPEFKQAAEMEWEMGRFGNVTNSCFTRGWTVRRNPTRDFSNMRRARPSRFTGTFVRPNNPERTRPRISRRRRRTIF